MKKVNRKFQARLFGELLTASVKSTFLSFRGMKWNVFKNNVRKIEQQNIDKKRFSQYLTYPTRPYKVRCFRKNSFIVRCLNIYEVLMKRSYPERNVLLLKVSVSLKASS